MTQTMLLGLAIILIATRLPSYFDRQDMSRSGRIISVITIYAFLGVVLLALNFFTYLIQFIALLISLKQ